MNEFHGPITEAYFLIRVGRPACDDDLDLCNCARAGQTGHTRCGWDWATNKPRFIALDEESRRKYAKSGELFVLELARDSEPMGRTTSGAIGMP